MPIKSIQLIKHGIALIVFICFVMFNLNGQNYQMQITSIVDKSGAKPSATFAIVEDHQGFIWFGTIDGLYRFDGFNYKVFRNQQNNPNSLSNNTIRDMTVDQNGKIWIATQGGGVNAFDPITESFTVYKHTGKNTTEIKGNLVWSVMVDKHNNVWLGISGFGLDKIDQATGKITHFSANNIAQGIGQEYDIRCILEDHEGHIWAGIENMGLVTLDTNTNKLKLYSNKTNEASYPLIRDILLTNNEQLWVATYGGGINVINNKTKTSHFITESDKETPIISDLTYSLIERVPGEFWIATEHGLSIYNSNLKTINSILPGNSGHEHISEERLRAIFVDSKGIVWTGTESGVEKFVTQKNFITYTNFFSDKPDISSAIVKSVTADENYFWIGFIDQGLIRYSKKDNSIKHFYTGNKKYGEAGIVSINALLNDQNNNLWINDWVHGFIKYDKKNDHFIQISNAEFENKRLLDNKVQRILEDKRGLLWIGTESGLNRYDIKTDSFLGYSHEPDNTNSLSSNSIQAQAMAFDQDSNLWLGTWSFGLNKMEFTDSLRINANFKRWKNDPQNPNSLPNNNVISLLHNNDILWIGTFGGGLIKMNKKTEEFKSYTTKNGLPNNIIFSIMNDKNGHLWLSTDFGISMFDPVKEIFYNYTQEDGLQDNHFFWGSAFKEKNGTILFGGIKGLNTFMPEQVKLDTSKAKPVIVDIKLFNESVSKSRFNTLSDMVKFYYHENFISIEFASLDYSEPKYNQYKYKLEGFDKEWVYSKSNNSASYTNLHPGNYIFKLQVSNSDGIWNNEILELKITIIPPWWNTWFARIVFIVLIISVFFSIYKLRVNMLHKQKHILEKEVADRTGELNTVLNEQKIILDNIGVGVAFIKDQFIWVNNAVTEILGYSKDELIGIEPSIIYASYEEYSKHLSVINKHLEKGEKYTDERIFITKDKKQIWANIVGTSIKHKDWTEGVIWLFQDITERKEHEFELKKAKNQAESANRAKSEFLANMSHEIRTPINAILGFSEILKDKVNNKTLSEYTKGIQTGGKNLLRLINDILDLSKVEAGKLEIELEPVNIRFLLNEIEQIFTLRVKEKSLNFYLKIDNDVPEGVLLDETRIRQVLFNLVGNAVKFTKTGNIKVSLYTNNKQTNKQTDLIFKIEDTGIGIPANQIKLIFEPFKQQIGQKTKQYKGTGLGLTISKKLIDIMNGDIQVQSKAGEGTVFTVTIPDVLISTHSVDILTNENANHIPVIEFDKAQILYAEDILSNRLVVKSYLEDYNIKIIEAENGEEAINLLKNLKFDLILMDIEMPVMNGIDAAKQIKSDEKLKHIPIIALTAYAMHSNKTKITKYCDGFLTKPVLRKDLINEIAKYLSHKVIAAKEKPLATSAEQKSIYEIFAEPNKLIPATLLPEFKKMFAETYNNVSKTFTIDEIELFANNLKSYAESNNLELLLGYSAILLDALHSFDFKEIEKLFAILKQILSS